MNKTFLFSSALIICALSFSCEEDDNMTTATCSTHAIVEDWTGLDGCGFLFKLDNGEYLEPLIVGWCGTPPISEEQMDDPLANFSLEDGQSVMISYEVTPDMASICMKGTIVRLTCIEEVRVKEETGL